MKDYRFLIFKFFFIIALFTIISCNEKKKFDGYLYPIRENGLYGYIDSVGNKIIEPHFLWASPFTNGLAVAVVDTIYREVADSMAYEVGERDSVINLYRMYAKYGYIDKTGHFAIKPTFVTYVTMPEKGYRVNDMTDCRNALSRYAFHSRRAMFCDTTTWKNGYINNNGDIVIEPRYYYSDPFSEGLAVVRDAVAEPLYTNKACITPSKLRCAYLDTLGNLITDFKYESLTRFIAGRGIGNYKKINRETVDIADTTIIWETYSIPRFLINADGKEIKELNSNYDYYGFSRDGISVAYDGFFIRSFLGKENISYYFINTDGDLLEPLNGLSEYQLDSLGKCGDIMQVLPDNAKISAATFFSDGFAGISPDKKHWFVIDKHLLIHGHGDESIYEGFGGYSNGVAAVKKNGKWGYINKEIKEQIPCKYDSCGLAYPFLEEIFEYDIQGKIAKVAYINRYDSLVWESKVPKMEDIKNKYSGKEIKNWGKWTYDGNTFQDNLQIWNLVALGCVLFVILLLWRTFSTKTVKKEVLVEQKQIVSIDEDTLTSSETSSIAVDDNIHFYPSIGQYTETIKLAAESPEDYFDKLSNLRPVLDANGEPIMSSGNFAVVFKMVDEKGKFHAVRCFHREQEGRGRSYRLICEELAKVSSPYLLPITYLEKELFVESSEYPVLLMDWVEGQTLDKYLRKIIANEQALRKLVGNFRQLAIWLLDQPFAHGDLKPDNILVKEDGSLVLVDYDGMFVPDMLGQKAREIGSPDYRIPSRNESVFDSNIDIFPIISILISLELIIENNGYINRYGAEDRLLFSEKDYRNINESRIFRIATASYRQDVPELAILLKDLIEGKDVDKEKLTSLLKGDSWKKELYANDIIEKPMRIFYAIYTIGIILFPFVMRSMRWSITEISTSMLCANIGLFLFLNIIDLMRPSPKYHIHAGGEGGFGCLGMFAVCIPLLLMTDVVSEYMINRSQYLGFLDLPEYNDEWYITLLNWIIWYFSFLLYGQSFTGSYEWRKKYYMTSRERYLEQKEKEMGKLREELKKEEEQQMGKKSREQKRNTMCDDLPF